MVGYSPVLAERRLTVGGEELRVTVSIGWATWGGESAEDLVRRADEALYDAKRDGRDTVRGAGQAAPAATLPRRR